MLLGNAHCLTPCSVPTMAWTTTAKALCFLSPAMRTAVPALLHRPDLGMPDGAIDLKELLAGGEGKKTGV